MIYYAKDFGILPSNEVGAKLNNLLDLLSKTKDKKTLIFECGNYFINSDTCVRRKLFITNTIGDNEWKENETPHLNKVAINLCNINGLVLDGKGCTFIMRGQMTNIAMSDCSEITLKNFSIRVENPDLHEFEVVKRGLFTAELKLDKCSDYLKEGNKFYFVGKDYKTPFIEAGKKVFWIGKATKKDYNAIRRTGHPLLGAIQIKELARNKFLAKFALPHNLKTGDKYYLFDVRRKFAGIFAERCDNLMLNNISQHFNYSLAVVCQDSENISIEKCNFTPHKFDYKNLTSVADFIQICMCRGAVVIKNNVFSGSGDDCLNTHGIHFKISDIQKNVITVSFCHPQTHGFNPLRVGDKIRFLNPNTLIGENYALIEKSEMINENDIKLTLDNADYAIVGEVIEDISACPDLNFSNNTLSRIMTRGLLITTRGKVIVKNNRFESTYMNSILISDDAKNWFESGSVQNVLIDGNYFGFCPGYNVCIKPENRVFKDYVHKNITICNNQMSKSGRGNIYAKNTDNIRVFNNKTYKNLKIKSIKSNITESKGGKYES